MYLHQRLLIFALLILGFTSQVAARQWVSADGSRTFDGSLINYIPPHVSVQKDDGQIITFNESVLSSADIGYCKSARKVLKKALRGARLMVMGVYADGIKCQVAFGAEPVDPFGDNELIFIWGEDLQDQTEEFSHLTADLFPTGPCSLLDEPGKVIQSFAFSVEEALQNQIKKSPPPNPEAPPGDSEGTSIGFGTGFAITSNGWVVTNEHVIRGCKTVTLYHDGKTADATVAFVDAANDLALLKTEVATVPLAVAFSDYPGLGDEITVGGYPNPALQGTSLKLTRGIISSLNGAQDDQRHYQIDAAIQPGNSGGPLLDERGRVVGIVVSRLNEFTVAEAFGSLPQNVNYCIKVSHLLSLLDKVDGLSARVGAVKEPVGERIGDVLQKST